MEKNMLRERAATLSSITDELWKTINVENYEIVEEFLNANRHLSDKTIKQYTSGLRQFFWFVKTNLKDKPLYDIKKRDFIKYFSYLQEHGLSSSALKFKKSAVSSLCAYVENVVVEDDDNYKNFRNFTTAVKDIPKNTVYEKHAISYEEYQLILNTFVEQENYLAACFVAMAFNIGARRNELRQFKSEIVNYTKKEGCNYIDSHTIFAKGRGGGKPVKYMINDEAMKYIKLWLEKRGYEHEYILTTKYKGEIHPVSVNWFNDLCSGAISNILGRRVNVHIFKSSCITYLLSQGKDIKSVSKHIAQHESVETTAIYDLRDDEEEKNSIY